MAAASDRKTKMQDKTVTYNSIKSTGAFLLLTALVLAGCQSRQDYRHAPMLEGRIVKPPEPNEPAAAHRPPAALPDDLQVDLHTAVQLALQYNPELHIAKHEADITARQADVARSAFFPQLSASATRLYLDDPVEFTVLDPPLIDPLVVRVIDKRINYAELQAQWMLWDFGRTLGRYHQAQFGSRAAHLQRARVRQQLIYKTSEAYFDVLRAQAALDIADDALTSARRQETLAERMFDQELIPRTDVLRARAQRIEFAQQKISAQNSVRLAVAALNRQMGIPVSSPIQVIEHASIQAPDVSLRDALQKAVDNRPEFVQIQHAISAARSGARAVRAEFLPEVFAAGSVRRLYDGHLLDQTRSMASIGIRMDLFTGGRRLAETEQAELRIRRSLASARQAADAIALQVHQAVLGIEDAWERLDVAEAGVDAASENRRLVRAQFREELVGSVEVADAEAVMTRARQSHAAAQYDYLQALQRLRFAVGTNEPEHESQQRKQTHENTDH